MTAASPKRRWLAALLVAAAITACAAPAPPEDARFPDIRHPKIGFASRQQYLDHFEKHGREFGRISSRDYLLMAQDLRDRPIGRDTLEFTRRDGVINRFDRRSGAYLAFNRNLTIRTFFKPNDGEAYFERQRRR